MKTILVWRFEDEHGGGIYQCGPRKDDRSSYMDIATEGTPEDMTNHLAPRYDEKLNIEAFDPDAESVFGFASIEQLKRWMYNSIWLHKLHEMGVQLNKYKVPVEHISIGHTQAAFRKEHATFVENVDLLSI